MQEPCFTALQQVTIRRSEPAREETAPGRAHLKLTKKQLIVNEFSSCFPRACGQHSAPHS